ncbi:amidohydrolase family protein [Phenylobacterium sp. VNQ135]|uniref:amidohydrolase family protein n=1 Tax=Phenylobacterium sp. VNQ135 TaxID=3400922 RepID=UPI003C12A969
MMLTVRNVEVNGRAGSDVRIERGRIAAISPVLPRGGMEIDGRGGALIPGLCDHHIHLFGLAARAASVPLEGVTSPSQFAERIAAGVATRPVGAWVRVFGYHETMAGELTRDDLDRLAPRHPLRLQHQTGALWVLNSLALASLGVGDDPPGVDRDTGRIWRGDAWLRTRIVAEPPPLDRIGARLAAYGITALTDASVTNDTATAAHLANACRTGALPQRLTVMSGGPIDMPVDGAFAVGPIKVLLDEQALIDLDDFVARIGDARTQGRKVAVHCVTAVELALTLAAFTAAGAEPGDRVEHGGVIPIEAIPQLRELNLAVVTQPAFIRERGDRYVTTVAAHERPDLYRCASLLAAGVPVAASSDAPYASPDPWVGITSAMDRLSAGGQLLGGSEAVSAARALGLYLDDPMAPGRRLRRIGVGAPADLCLLNAPLSEVLAQPSCERVAATIIRGDIVYLG